MDELTTSKKDELKERKGKSRQERELADIKKLLGFPEGRRFIWKTLSKTGIFQSSFTGDNNVTNFKEGQRSVGLWLLAEVFEAKPDAYLQMQQEHRSELISERQELQKADEEI